MNLKPCPFCGNVGQAIRIIGGMNDSAAVHCSCGGSCSGWPPTNEGATAAWNRRAAPAQEMLQELKHLLRLLETPVHANSPRPSEPTLAAARAIIAKAEERL